MLPKFPEFKRLELTDQKDVETITKKHPPYSDFDFENMWSWDINDSMRISDLNGNLVLLTKDIFTSGVSCSYLGNAKLDNTLYNLFDFLDTTEVPNPRMSLIPEDSLKGLDFGKYFIEIDLNTCDYIYDLKQLAGYAGNRFMQKRGRTNSFIRNYPNTRVSILNLKDPQTQREVLNLNHAWVQNKIKFQGDTDDKELRAIERFIDADFKNVYSLGVYHEEKLIGHAIFSFHGKNYVINHFIKADVIYKGVYEFLMRECAIKLSELGYQFLNYLEDMGIPGLRQAKMTYRPVKFLKKYFVNRL